MRNRLVWIAVLVALSFPQIAASDTIETELVGLWQVTPIDKVTYLDIRSDSTFIWTYDVHNDPYAVRGRFSFSDGKLILVTESGDENHLTVEPRDADTILLKTSTSELHLTRIKQE